MNRQQLFRYVALVSVAALAIVFGIIWSPGLDALFSAQPLDHAPNPCYIEDAFFAVIYPSLGPQPAGKEVLMK